MPIPSSSFYEICDAMAEYVRVGLQAVTHDIHIYLGAPAEIAGKKDEHRISLFFYRFEPSGFQAGAHPQDPWRLRLFCMFSCMAAEDNIDNPGADDLRLLGLVMALFHERPVLPLIEIGGEQLRLQVVFNPSSDEQLNQLWSIQGETGFRPSLVYEFALAPVMPQERRGEPPRVGTFGLETGAAIDARYAPFGGSLHVPLATAQQVDTANPAWAPLVCWVDADQCIGSLSLDVDVTDPAVFTPTLWVAGLAGANVTLEWQIWQGDRWSSVPGINLVISSQGLDPDLIPVALPQIDLPPLDIDAEHDRWQLLLHATREYQPMPGSPPLTLRSNPLLISLYRGA